MVDAGYSRNDVKPSPVAVTNTVAKEDKSDDEPKKPRRNVQASDATHEVKNPKVEKVQKDEKSGNGTPAPTADPTPKAEPEANEPAEGPDPSDAEDAGPADAADD
jgi:hypothetical protein